MGKRRSFSIEQKMQILREADSTGMVTTLRKYEISHSLFYRWKNQFDSAGIDGLKPHYYKLDPETKELREENEKLKKIIARQALELEVKSELLKKTEQLRRRGYL
jgi:transposase-like protein